jgi:hypothetical protein
MYKVYSLEQLLILERRGIMRKFITQAFNDRYIQKAPRVPDISHQIFFIWNVNGS